MQTLELSYLILAVEFSLIALMTLAYMLYTRRRTVVADAAGAQALQAEITEREPTRRDALRKIFSERYNIKDAVLDAKVEEFVERERSFYETLLSVYVQHDPEGLSKMGGELNKVIAPWVSMVPEGMVDGPTAEALQNNLTELNSQNRNLSEELDHTKQVMEGLLDEYNAAFGHQAAMKLATEPLDVPGDGADSSDNDLSDLEITMETEVVLGADTQTPEIAQTRTDTPEVSDQPETLSAPDGDTTVSSDDEDLSPEEIDDLLEQL